MWYIENNFTVRIGSNTYQNVPNIIVYKGDKLFTIKRATSTGLLGIDFDIYDANKKKIAVVKQGRIYSGRQDLYEITVHQNQYLLKEKETGRTICDIKKRGLAGKTELDVAVSLYTKDGFLIEATSEKTNIPGRGQIINCHFSDMPAAIVIK